MENSFEESLWQILCYGAYRKPHNQIDISS